MVDRRPAGTEQGDDQEAGQQTELQLRAGHLRAHGGAQTHWWTGAPDGQLFFDGHSLVAGNHGQFIYVAPDRDLVIVRLGDSDGNVDWPQILASIAAQMERSL